MSAATHRRLPPPYASCAPVVTAHGPRGTLWGFEPEPHVLYTQVVGHLSLPQVRELFTAMDRIYDRGLRVWAVHDWEAAPTYDPEVRALFTQWAIDRRAALAGSLLLTQSNLVAMGVSVVRLALLAAGVEIHATTKREDFSREFLRIARSPKRIDGRPPTPA